MSKKLETFLFVAQLFEEAQVAHITEMMERSRRKHFGEVLPPLCRYEPTPEKVAEYAQQLVRYAQRIRAVVYVWEILKDAKKLADSVFDCDVIVEYPGGARPRDEQEHMILASSQPPRVGLQPRAGRAVHGPYWIPT